MPEALTLALNGEEVDGIPGTGCCCIEVLFVDSAVDGIVLAVVASSGVLVVEGDDGDDDDDVEEEGPVVEGNIPEFLDNRL